MESRCRMCCNGCERRESEDCQGCGPEKRSFLGGECMIKSCCEIKGFQHCGECQEFPCDLLKGKGGFDPLPKIGNDN